LSFARSCDLRANENDNSYTNTTLSLSNYM